MASDLSPWPMHSFGLIIVIINMTWRCLWVSMMNLVCGTSTGRKCMNQRYHDASCRYPCTGLSHVGIIQYGDELGPGSKRQLGNRSRP